MKKRTGLLAIIAILVSFMAFSGVASAQASNAQVTFFTSPFCSACQAAQPIVDSAAAKYGVTVTYIDVTANPGKGIATANGITETPTIIVTGAQNTRFEGSVTQGQMEVALKAAVGTPKPTPTVTPKTTPTVKQTTPAYIGNKATKVVHTSTCWHLQEMNQANMVPFNTLADAIAQGYTPCKDCIGAKPTATPTVTPTPTGQPPIHVVTVTPTTPTSTVPEFSILGLGAPALVISAIYLFLRRR